MCRQKSAVWPRCVAFSLAPGFSILPAAGCAALPARRPRRPNGRPVARWPSPWHCAVHNLSPSPSLFFLYFVRVLAPSEFAHQPSRFSSPSPPSPRRPALPPDRLIRSPGESSKRTVDGVLATAVIPAGLPLQHTTSGPSGRRNYG